MAESIDRWCSGTYLWFSLFRNLLALILSTAGSDYIIYVLLFIQEDIAERLGQVEVAIDRPTHHLPNRFNLLVQVH
jgi:hypothetical protein